MTSGRAGARVDRWKSWKRHNPLALCLILLFALVAIPATSVFAAYGQSFVGTITSTYGPNASTFILGESGTGMPYIEVVSYGSVRLNGSWADQDLYADGYICSGYFSGQMNWTCPNTTSWTAVSSRMIIDGFSYENYTVSRGTEYYWNNTNGIIFTSRFQMINQRPNIGINIAFHVVATYKSTSTTHDVTELTSARPTISLASTSVAGEYLPMESLLPDLQRIRQGLLDPTTGWLPTMNTNLQTLVTQQNTTNSWLNTQSGQLTQVLSHLAGVRSNQQTQISNESTIISNQSSQIQKQNTQIVNQETQISQLQQIVDYINSTQAAAAVDQANQDFVNDAGAMESQQSVLEAAADASVAAVDMQDINIIDNFSQSVTFWGQLVAQLPTVLGSLWSVFIFGLLIAFVLFVLRIRR